MSENSLERKKTEKSMPDNLKAVASLRRRPREEPVNIQLLVEEAVKKSLESRQTQPQSEDLEPRKVRKTKKIVVVEESSSSEDEVVIVRKKGGSNSSELRREQAEMALKPITRRPNSLEKRRYRVDQFDESEEHPTEVYQAPKAIPMTMDQFRTHYGYTDGYGASNQRY